MQLKCTACNAVISGDLSAIEDHVLLGDSTNDAGSYIQVFSVQLSLAAIARSVNDALQRGREWFEQLFGRNIC